MAGHTKLPWSLYSRYTASEQRSIAGANLQIMPPGFDIAAPKNEWPFSVAQIFCASPNADANAEFIVRACNAHDDLLAACQAMLEETENRGRGGGDTLYLARAQAIAAIQKAGR